MRSPQTPQVKAAAMVFGCLQRTQVISACKVHLLVVQRSATYACYSVCTGLI